MARRTFILCILIIASACVLPFTPSVAAKPLQICPVVTLEGSWRKIGEDTAYYFRDTIQLGARGFKALGVTPTKAEKYYHTIKKYVHQDIQAQLAGIAEGLSEVGAPAFPRSKELIWNFAMDILESKKMGCTAFAVTSPSGTFLAHNTDNVAVTTGMNTVIHYKPDNGDYSFLSFFAPGFVGVGMAINDQKLALSFNVGKSANPQKPGLPVVFKAREVMATCADLACAERKFRGLIEEEEGNYGHLGANLIIVDFKGPAMARLEICSDTITVTPVEGHQIDGVTYTGVTNHSEGDCAPPTPNGPAPSPWLFRLFGRNRPDSSLQRYERLIQMLQTEGISHDMQTCWWILTDSSGTGPNDSTICRKGPIISTTASHVFTEHYCYYSLGLPSTYLGRYGRLRFIDLDDGLSRAVQPSITGTARRGKSIVPSAPVALISYPGKGVRLKTYTDPNGRFVFNNLDPGTYKIRNGKKPLHRCSPGTVVTYNGKDVFQLDSLPMD